MSYLLPDLQPFGWQYKQLEPTILIVPSLKCRKYPVHFVRDWNEELCASIPIDNWMCVY